MSTAPNPVPAPDSSIPSPAPGSPKVQPVVSILAWGLLVVSMAAIFGTALYQYIRPRLAGPLPEVLTRVPPISLEAQDGRNFTEAEFLKGRYHVLDFIFTRCGGQCPKMTQSMAEFQKFLISENWDDVHLVSVTVDPDNDTSATLREYGEKFGADFRRWSFLRGPASTVYPWGNNGLMLATKPNPGGSQTGGEEFIHSPKFVLIDPKGQVRGYFTGTDPEEMKALRETLRRLRFAGPNA